MFLHAYQSGTHVEVFNSQNRSNFPIWNTTGPVGRAFDRPSRSFVLNLGATARASIPKSSKDTLGLVQPYVVFQALFPKGKLLTIEIGFTDNTGTLRRLIFTQGREIVKNQLHARIPADAIVRGTWVNLCVDVVSFVRECFPACTLRSVDSISLSGMALIKRVFTMRIRLRDTTSEEDSSSYFYEPVPVSCEIPRQVTCVNQFLDIDRVFCELKPLAYSSSPPKSKQLSMKVQFKNIFSPVSPTPNKLYKSQKSDDLKMMQLQESTSKLLKNRSQAPELDEWMLKMLQIRHFTPPFVGVLEAHEELRYDPVLKSYEYANEVK